jgi:L-asparaginase
MKKILLLQTGGTIAMHFDRRREQLDPDRWSEVLYREMPELSKIADIEVQSIFFEDSSDLSPKEWTKLAERIENEKNNYSGFVILHGTDTMAYTASALSFALPDIDKPVILTGSQVPMSRIRSDAKRNLVNSIELATLPVPEVAICFNDHLYRGNRTTKMSIGDFDAFASPNYPPLAEIGIHIELSENIRTIKKKNQGFHPAFSDRVFVLKIYPGLNPRLLDSIQLEDVGAVILEAFGTGNIPVQDKYNLIPFIERCRMQDCHVLVTSQAAYDAVDLSLYKSGRELDKLGALSAGEMTMEATLTKTMNLLAMNLSERDFSIRFCSSTAGEREAL